SPRVQPVQRWMKLAEATKELAMLQLDPIGMRWLKFFVTETIACCLPPKPPVTGVTGVTRVRNLITIGILAVTRAAETCDRCDNPSHAGPCIVRPGGFSVGPPPTVSRARQKC